MTIRTARDVELAQQAGDSLAPADSGTFDAFAESARTEVLTPEPQHHRREGKGGWFRRHSARAASH